MEYARFFDRKWNSSLFVTKKVQRRTLASGTYPNALLPFAALVLRAPPPVTVVAFLAALVKKSAMLSAVRTKGTRISNSSTMSRTK